MAVNINRELERVGFINLGVNERPNLVVLNRTQMPAVLVEVGFINTDNDNELFDRRFMEIAWAIAQGIVRTFYPGWDIYPLLEEDYQSCIVIRICTSIIQSLSGMAHCYAQT